MSNREERASEFAQQIKQLIPELTAGSHKGQAGKSCIIGGSAAYTGAPYFSSMTTLKLGMDLATVCCSVDAAIPIKSYSPELMTRPTLIPKYLANIDGINENCGSKHSEQQVVDSVVKTVSSDVIDRGNHVIIVGPGLGKDELVMKQIAEIFKLVRSKDLPIIVDGDGIHALTESPDTLKGYQHAVITPNAAEFRRLYIKYLPDTEPPAMSLPVDDKLVDFMQQNQTGGILELTDPLAKDTVELANAMGGVTIIRKGPIDVISNGKIAVYCSSQGALRRCGGQGDVLTGVIGSFLAWSSIREAKSNESKRDDHSLPGEVIAGYAGCLFVRQSAHNVFQRHGRSMLASHLVDEMEHIIEQWAPVRAKI